MPDTPLFDSMSKIEQDKKLIEHLDFEENTACESTIPCAREAKFLMVYKCCGHTQELCAPHTQEAKDWFISAEAQAASLYCLACERLNAPTPEFFPLVKP
jgi:hypothetical protein